MTVVVDASVAVMWLLPEERSSIGRTLLRSRHELATIELMRVEVASAILKNKRLGRLSLDTARTAMLALNTVPVRMLPVGSHVGTAFAIAQHHGGSVYDACYIAFARSLDASLATDDEGMAQVAEAVGVTVHRASQGFAALLD